MKVSAGVTAALGLFLLAACSVETRVAEPVRDAGGAASHADAELSEWSAPERLDISTAGFAEITPAIATNGLALYFASNRPGGPGLLDIYVTTRTKRKPTRDKDDHGAFGTP